MLEEVALSDLSVAQIIEQAEISRATFYFYFSSKYDVVVGLLAKIMNDVYDVASPFINRLDDDEPVAAMRRVAASSRLDVADPPTGVARRVRALECRA